VHRGREAVIDLGRAVGVTRQPEVRVAEVGEQRRRVTARAVRVEDLLAAQLLRIQRALVVARRERRQLGAALVRGDRVGDVREAAVDVSSALSP
jgi:hypothetical protein